MSISLYLFLHCLRKCCACVKLCTVHCESAAPAAELVPLAKVLRLPRKLDRTLRKSCTCRKSVPDLAKVLRLLLKSVPDLPKALRLPRNLYLTLRTCCACREICTAPCESAAPAAKSVPDLRKHCAYLAKALRLPRNLYLTLRKCFACHEMNKFFLFPKRFVDPLIFHF